MSRECFSHVRAWVFDLDNTLYPPQTRLFDQIEVRMTQYVMDTLRVDHAQANHLRDHYWRTHGTTLAGLMQEHGIDPDPFLVQVHDIDMTHIDPDPDLAARITGLPGRRIVYTNGSAPYAERVLERRGLSGLFDAIYGVEHGGFVPKPARHAFETVFALDGLDIANGAMFEDDPRNLAVPHDMGMRTVHVAPDPSDAAHVQHHTDDLAGFLARLV